MTKQEYEAILSHVADNAVEARRAEREMRRWKCADPDDHYGPCNRCEGCAQKNTAKGDRDLARKRMRHWADKALDERRHA